MHNENLLNKALLSFEVCSMLLFLNLGLPVTLLDTHALLFSFLELPGLHCVGYIQSLQQEAHQALKEHVKSTCTQDQSRFFNLIIALSMVRCIGAGVIVELFFRPIGNDNIDDKLVDMLCVDNKAQAAEKIST